MPPNSAILRPVLELAEARVASRGALRDVLRQTVDFLAEALTKKTFDGSSRFLMLDMRWKGLERLIRMSQVSAQGDAVFLAFSRRENPTKPYLG